MLCLRLGVWAHWLVGGRSSSSCMTAGIPQHALAPVSSSLTLNKFRSYFQSKFLRPEIHSKGGLSHLSFVCICLPDFVWQIGRSVCHAVHRLSNLRPPSGNRVVSKICLDILHTQSVEFKLKLSSPPILGFYVGTYESCDSTLRIVFRLHTQL